MQSKPMKETDPHDVFAIESLLHAHAERAPPLAHDPATVAAAPPLHVTPPISVGAPISHAEPPPFEPAFPASDARDIPSEIKVDGLQPPGTQPTSRLMKRIAMAVLALFGATAAAGWHQYGDQAKAMAAEWTPPFVLAALPSATRPAAAEQPGAPVAEASAPDQAAAQQPAAATAANQPAPAAAAATPPAAEANQLQSMAQDLAAMGQQVEELKATIAQLKASQAQMARELAKATEAKAAEIKPADTRPIEPNPRPKVSALTPPAQRPAQLPVRKPKPMVSTYAPAPIAAAPPLPPQVAPLPPAPPAQTIADDGQPVVRPPMPLR